MNHDITASLLYGYVISYFLSLLFYSYISFIRMNIILTAPMILVKA
jgi:hypothetical protein